MISEKNTLNYEYNKRKDTDIENKVVVTSGCRREEEGARQK